MSQPIKAKMNRGPMHGQRVIVPGPTLIVRQPSKIDWRKSDLDPYAPLDFTEGTYVKSNKKLKDGTWIYEWMGWYE